MNTNNKRIGYVGLGKMGKNMVTRLLDHSWNVVAYNRSPEAVGEVVKLGAIGVDNIGDLIAKLETPRIVWLMVSHQAVDEMIAQVSPHLSAGDVLIDGGNSPYQESIRRQKELKEKGITYLDIGVSGGPGGCLHGACMMIGGDETVYRDFEQSGFFTDTCAPDAYRYLGKSGSGHYAKMVHNGIEYGMMQAIAEGFDLLRHTKEFDFDIQKVTEIYANKSVIDSRLVSWMLDAYKKYGKDLNDISGKASASGEGKWTVEAGKREGIGMPVIEVSLEVRMQTQSSPSYQGKVISAMRGEFGQHPVVRGEDEPEVL
jgi:6-phosphogluconate dehydrogenase